MVYDLTVLKGASILDYFLIANYWTEGLLFIGISILTAFLVFVIAKYSNQETITSYVVAMFSGFFVSLFFWLLKFQGSPTIPTYIPFIFAIFLGIGVLAKVYFGRSQ